MQYFSNFADSYLDALEEEFTFRNVSKELETIYIGGGTPTSLSDAQFERLLKMILPYSNKVKEYTIEANPESLSTGGAGYEAWDFLTKETGEEVLKFRYLREWDESSVIKDTVITFKK